MLHDGRLHESDRTMQPPVTGSHLATRHFAAPLLDCLHRPVLVKAGHDDADRRMWAVHGATSIRPAASVSMSSNMQTRRFPLLISK